MSPGELSAHIYKNGKHAILPIQPDEPKTKNKFNDNSFELVSVNRWILDLLKALHNKQQANENATKTLSL